MTHNLATWNTFLSRLLRRRSDPSLHPLDGVEDDEDERELHKRGGMVGQTIPFPLPLSVYYMYSKCFSLTRFVW